MVRLWSALCVLAQLVMACHFALVTHTRCAHGDLIHADEHGHATSMTTTEPAAHEQSAALVAAADDAGHDGGHDHCVAAHDRRKTLTNLAPAVTRAPETALPAVAWLTVDRPRARPLYRDAPKTSPPVA